MNIPIKYQKIGLAILFIIIHLNNNIAYMMGSMTGSLFISYILVKIYFLVSKKKIDNEKLFLYILIFAVVTSLINFETIGYFISN